MQINDEQYSPFHYNFPAYQGGSRTDGSCANKIVEEAKEYAEELENGNAYDALVELLDTIHACETMLRRYDEDVVLRAKIDVLRKNMNRGYYSEYDTARITLGMIMIGGCENEG